MLNGLSLSPRVDIKFDSQVKKPTNGNNICNKEFGTCATRRHNEFKEFFALQDYMKPVGLINKHLNYKLKTLLNQSIKISKAAIQEEGN